jgi:hypothetical protein
MHVLVACALVIGLPSFLILGFLEVAGNLLSRDVIGAPTLSSADASRTQEGTGDAGVGVQ